MADQKAYDANKITDPADNLEVLLGTSTSKIVNITLANFYTKLTAKLPFLKRDNYLNEYSGSTSMQLSARTYINAASRSEVLTTGNTTPYTPTQNYHPATVKYVIDYVNNKIVAGSMHFGDAGASSTVVVSIGKTMADANYFVFLTFVGSGNTLYPAAVGTKTTTTFEIVISEAAGLVQDAYLNWLIISYA